MAHTSFEIARKAMIDSQIRPNKVIDERVVAAFAQTPREEFVPKSLRDVAYVDEDLALSGGRYMVEAMVMGRLLQALEIETHHNVLLIGAGTGYTAALLSHLSSSVIAIDNRTPAVQKAQELLGQMEIGNVAVLKGKITEGYPSEGPYDAILVEGGVEVMPDDLLAQLAPNGKLAAIWRESDKAQGEASLWTKAGEAFVRRSLFNAQVPTLVEFRAKPEFQL
ncbi:MAG: protein-L-isoaspartate O-methyltransferase family protein [Candidatus Puniceispirillaceae bacterium]